MVKHNLDLVVVGNLAEDVVFGESFYGGSAGNIALNASTFGLSTGIISSCGKDSFSHDYIDHLQQKGVITDYIAESLELMPSCVVSSSINHSSSKEWFDNGSTQSLRDYVFTDKIRHGLSSAAIIHSTTVPPELVQRLIDSKGIKTIMGYEPGPRILHDKTYFSLDMFKACDILFLNEEEASALGDEFSITLLQRYMHDNQVIITTKGPGGCLYITRDSVVDIPVESPVLEGNIVDSSGAGDAFRVGFYVGLVNRMTPRDSAALANEFGRMIVRQNGAILNNDAVLQLTDRTTKYIH